MAKLAALAVVLLLYSPSASAWGGLGHEAVCELAFLELDDTARQRVIALIQLDHEFTTFRASCNWADRPRQRASEHFVNLPRDATGLDGNDCPLADECVVSAIAHDFAVLASPSATDEEKLVALKFLGTGSAIFTSPCTLRPGTTGAAITSARGHLVREPAYALGQVHRRGAARDASAPDRARTPGRHHRRAARRVAGQ